MTVGESPQIDGGLLVIILVIFVLACAAVIGVVVAGCVWAGRAGRGSRRARAGWAAVAVLEGIVVLEGLVELASGRGEPITVIVAGGALGLQALLYTRARRGRAPEARDR